VSSCDACGRSIGHTEEITALYDPEEVDLETPDWDDNRAVFGSHVCKDEFERHHEVSEKVRCNDCGKYVDKDKVVEVEEMVEGALKVTTEYCQECKRDSITETGRGENQQCR
jgi:hypothetical protein